MRPRLIAIAAILVALTATCAAQGGANISPVSQTAATDALMEKLGEVIGSPSFVELPAVVLELIPSATDSGTLCVLAAKFRPADATARVTGRLLALLIDTENLTRESIITVRLVLPGEGQKASVAYATLASEGEELELAHAAENDWRAAIMTVPSAPDRLADAMATVGESRIGGVRAPKGLHLVMGRAGGGQLAAFQLPTLAELAQREVTWSKSSAMP